MGWARTLTYRKLAAFLKAEREREGVSQVEVSRAIGLSSQSLLSNWERGINQPRDFDEMQRWARAVGYELELVERDGSGRGA